MKLMPEILEESRDDETISFRIRVPPDLEHFAGHFPELPILPGIVQLDWAVRLARRHIPELTGSRETSNLKFQALVHPGAELTLRLNYDEERNTLNFSFREDERTCSSGRIRFQSDAG